MSLQEFKDSMAKDLFGMTLTEAHEKKVCVDCKAEMWKLDGLADIDRKEWHISGLCPVCFQANALGV